MSIYVFGYGSLINMSDNKVLFLKNKRKICPVMVSGLKRSFNVSSTEGKYKVLGVKESTDKNKQCNGILIEITDSEELAKLIKREKNYTPRQLAPERLSFPYKKHLSLNNTDQIICFYPQTKYILKKKEAAEIKIRPKYLQICLAGARDFGEDFLHDFTETLDN
jgi:hypothetical protein